MDSLGSAFMNSDSVIIREIFKVLSSIRIRGGTVDVLCSLFTGVNRIVIIFLLQYYMKNTDKIMDVIKSCCRTLLYRRKVLNMSVTGTELHMARRLKFVFSKKDTQSYKGIPYYFNVEGDRGVLEYIPGIQRSMYHEFESLAQKDHQSHSSKSTKSTKCHLYKSHNIVPKKLFPSQNYQKLDEIISSYFEICQLTGIFSSKGILIDGEPGLGKSDSIEYLASLNTYGEVLRVDMTQRLDDNLNDIIKDIGSARTVTYIVLIDELDKYVSHAIRRDYQKLKFEHNKDKGELPSYLEYIIDRKEKILFQLLSLVDNTYHTKGAVYIFSSNNFETIFENVNERQFASFHRRFTPVRFERCDRQELQDYLKHYNEKFVGTKWHREPEKLESIIDKLRLDVSLTYHDICEISLKSCYHVESIVKSVNEFERSSLIYSSSEPHTPVSIFDGCEKEGENISVAKKSDSEDEDSDSEDDESPESVPRLFTVEKIGIPECIDLTDEREKEILAYFKRIVAKANRFSIVDVMPFVNYINDLEVVRWIDSQPKFKQAVLNKLLEFEHVISEKYTSYSVQYRLTVDEIRAKFNQL